MLIKIFNFQIALFNMYKINALKFSIMNKIFNMLITHIAYYCEWHIIVLLIMDKSVPAR